MKIKLFLALIITLGFLNMVSATLCYQESANTTDQMGTDGACSQNYTGTYQFSPTSWFNTGGAVLLTNYFDGNWSTGTTANGSTTVLNLHFNTTYIKPPNANASSFIRMGFSNTTTFHETNLTIPLSCWNANTTSLKITSRLDKTSTTNFNNSWWCWNNTAGIVMDSYNRTQTNAIRMAEDAMYWDIGSGTSNCWSTLGSKNHITYIPNGCVYSKLNGVFA